MLGSLAVQEAGDSAPRNSRQRIVGESCRTHSEQCNARKDAQDDGLETFHALSSSRCEIEVDMDDLSPGFYRGFDRWPTGANAHYSVSIWRVLNRFSLRIPPRGRSVSESLHSRQKAPAQLVRRRRGTALCPFAARGIEHLMVVVAARPGRRAGLDPATVMRYALPAG